VLHYKIPVETFWIIREDCAMEHTHQNPLPGDAAADAHVIMECVAARKPVPPEVVSRVRERAAQARKMLLATHGVQDIGVQIIREIRGELPQQ
jgi:hypothetical protein